MACTMNSSSQDTLNWIRGTSLYKDNINEKYNPLSRDTKSSPNDVRPYSITV